MIVPAITFLATASAPHLAGAEIVFADVDPESGLMRAEDLEAALARAPQKRADAVFPVHYAGQSCDMAPIAEIARAKTMKIVEDAAHALGTVWRGDDGAVQSVGANEFSDLTIFSFHPVKTVAMGEGGAVSTNDPELLRRLKQARNHGITREPLEFKRVDASFDSTGARQSLVLRARSRRVSTGASRTSIARSGSRSCPSFSASSMRAAGSPSATTNCSPRLRRW